MNGFSLSRCITPLKAVDALTFHTGVLKPYIVNKPAKKNARNIRRANPPSEDVMHYKYMIIFLFANGLIANSLTCLLRVFGLLCKAGGGELMVINKEYPYKGTGLSLIRE